MEIESIWTRLMSVVEVECNDAVFPVYIRFRTGESLAGYTEHFELDNRIGNIVLDAGCQQEGECEQNSAARLFHTR